MIVTIQILRYRRYFYYAVGVDCRLIGFGVERLKSNAYELALGLAMRAINRYVIDRNARIPVRRLPKLPEVTCLIK